MICKRKKYRVLFIGDYPVNREGPISGPQRATANIINGVHLLGEHYISVLLPHRMRCLLTKMDMLQNEPPVYRIHFISIFKFMMSFKPDIIHISGIEYLGLFSFLFKFFNKKVKIIYTAHGLLSQESKYNLNPKFFEKFSEKMLIKNGTAVTTVSEIMKQMIVKDYNVPGSKVFVVPNSFDLSLHCGSIKKGNKPIEIASADGQIILFIGRLDMVKGLSFLLDALLKLKKYNFRLLVVGDQTAYWKQAIKNYPIHLANKIKRLDSLSQNELANVYASCNFLVLPSEYEPFGLVALEAMAFKKPVIVSDRVGMSPLIMNNKNGFIVEFGNSEELAAKISDLLRNEDKQRDVGEQAFLTSKQFTYDKVAREYISLYDNLD